jgi:hypothetical protein
MLRLRVGEFPAGLRVACSLFAFYACDRLDLLAEDWVVYGGKSRV